MVGDYMLDKVLDKIKMIIGIKKFDDTKILIEADDKLLDDVTLKNVVIIITCAIKNAEKKGNDKFDPQVFLEEAKIISIGTF